MDDVPLRDLPAVAIYARLGVVAHQLGIDGFQLESSRKQLTAGVNAYARVWLDADARHLALRTMILRPPMLERPGATYLELETNPDAELPNGTLFVSGPRTLDEDLQLLATGGTGADIVQLDTKLRGPQPVSPGVLDLLRRNAGLLGASTIAVLGQRMNPRDLHWLLGIALPADSVREVSMAAESLSVAPYQVAMLGALHGELAANGCIATLACGPSAIRPELIVEYRDLAWAQVIATANRLRTGKTGGAFGVLAGGFSAERAAFLEITFRSDQVARVRAAIEVVSQVA